MRRLIKKWGESLLAALCVLAIVFAALYTRQDDLRRLAAQNAAASQDETLGDVAASPWARPVDGAALTPFSGAVKENGIWRFSPWVRYGAAYGAAVRAMHAGTVIRADQEAVLLRDENGTESEYRNLSSLRVKEKDIVSAGEALGTAGSTGWIEVAILYQGAYADPEKLLTAP